MAPPPHHPLSTDLGLESALGYRQAIRDAAASRIADISAALLPPEYGGPDPRMIAADYRLVVRHLPASQRRALNAAARTFTGVSRAWYGKRLLSLHANDRAAAVQRVRQLPGGVDAVEGAKRLILMIAGLAASEARSGVGAPAEVVSPDPPLQFIDPGSAGARVVCDAVVIGSGAGGAAVARILSHAGMNTIIVEEGKHAPTEWLRQARPVERLVRLYRDAGSTFALGIPPVLIPTGRAVGGTTVINSATWLRPPDRVVDAWATTDELGAAEQNVWRGVMGELEARLGVSRPRESALGANSALVASAARSLGWNADVIHRNAQQCQGSTVCALGCPTGAKWSTAQSLLADACEGGARILSGVRVERLTPRSAMSGADARGWSVAGVFRDAESGELRSIDVLADRVVLAAGALQTPLLLRRSSMADHPSVGHNLSVHPTATLAAHLPAELRIDPDAPEVMQSVVVDSFHGSEGILIEATKTPVGLSTHAIPGDGARLVEALNRDGELLALGAMVADSTTGRVRGLKTPTVTYRLDDTGAIRLRRSLELQAEIAFAAGATSVLPSIVGLDAPITSMSQLRQLLSRTHTSHLNITAFHPSGTVRMGRDDRSSPVDERGALRGYDGVWIADASVLPTSPEVNPQATIMALSTSIARSIIADG